MKKTSIFALINSLFLLVGCQGNNSKVEPGTLDDVVFPDDSGEKINPPQPVTLPSEGSEAPGSLDLSNISLSYYDNEDFHKLSGQWNGYGVHYPSIFKYNNEYFLYLSTPDSNIGIRAYKSNDLVNWSLATKANYPLGYICKDRETYGLKGPKVLFYQDQFYLYGNSPKGYRLFTSSSPEGPFSYYKDLNFASSYNSSIFQAPNGKLFFVTGGDKEAYLYEMNDIDEVDLNSKAPISSTRINESSGLSAIVESPSLYSINDTLYLLYSSQKETYTSYRSYVVSVSYPQYDSSLKLAQSFFNDKQGPVLVSTNRMNESIGYGDLSIVEGIDSVSYYALYTTYESDSVRRFNISPICYSSFSLSISHRLSHSAMQKEEIHYLEDDKYENRILSNETIEGPFVMDIYASDLEETYFGYKTNNNCYAITFEEETVSLVRRVNGLNQVIKSAQIVGKQHIIKVISNESLHVFVDGLDLAFEYAKEEDIQGLIGYKKTNDSIIESVSYVLSSSDIYQQNAFKDGEIVLPGKSLFVEGSHLSATNYIKKIENDQNFKEALLLEKYHDYARYLVDVRNTGRYGIEIVCNAAFSKYRCHLGLRAGTNEEYIYQMENIADSGYVRTLTAEFDLLEGCNEILIENLSTLPLEIVSVSLRRVSITTPSYQHSLAEYITTGAYYDTDFLLDSAYQCHRTYEGARSFAYVGDNTISDCVYEIEVGFASTLVVSGFVTIGFRCDNFASSRLDNDESGTGYFLEISQFQTKLMKHNYGYGKTLGVMNLANSIGSFSNYIITMRGNYIEIYRDTLLVFSIIDSLMVSTGHLGFGATDTCGLIRNINVHGEAK